ncbi:MAG: cyclodeaminase/cyclohydrolase family protein [Deltaproteobacteria bacterium]|jgi:formiminotetrahydrofolate cyclodeaminase|nr:cyclodeaminase/cyclohydrolase family protein [Deltaproteobacteria bacterium]
MYQINSSLYTMTLDEVLKLAASRSHAPGGGSVAAMSGAMGAAMASMAANLTIGKGGYEGVWELCSKYLSLLEEGLADLKERSLEDMRAFDKVMAALRLPKGSKREVELRLESIQLALKDACEVPLSLAEKIVSLMEVNLALAEVANQFAVSDCGVAAILLESAARAALISIEVNRKELIDKDYSRLLEARKRSLEEASQKLLKRTLKSVKERQSYSISKK